MVKMSQDADADADGDGDLVKHAVIIVVTRKESRTPQMQSGEDDDCRRDSAQSGASESCESLLIEKLKMFESVSHHLVLCYSHADQVQSTNSR